MTTINPNMLEYAWTAEVELNNGQEITIWWTAWPMSKQVIKNILWIASDLPRYELKDCRLYDNEKEARRSFG